MGAEVTRAAEPVPIEELTDLIGEFRLLIDDVYDLSKAFKEHPPTMVSLRLDVTD